MAENIMTIAEDNADVNGVPIVRVTVKETESDTEQGVNVKTCARAVTCDEGKTAQEHINDLQNHLNNPAIHSNAFIALSRPVTIPTSGWLPSGVTAFPYAVEIEADGVTNDHSADVVVEVGSIETAVSCGLCPTMETLAGKVKFYARTTPSAAISCHMTLYGDSGTDLNLAELQAFAATLAAL